MMSARWILLWAALLLLGCSERSDDAAQQRSHSSVAASSRSLGNPFPDAAEVRLFVHNGEYDGSGRSILASAEGKTLTGAQRASFEAALSIEPMPDSMDACFMPHHFFRYLDARGREIGEIKVCFCCEGVAVKPAPQASVGSDEIVGADYAALKSLVESMGERTDIECAPTPPEAE